MILPFEKPILTSGFGNRNINGKIEFHPGIDVIPSGSGLWIENGQLCGGDTAKIKQQVNKRLQTVIVSCLDGVVSFAGQLFGGGFTVIIDSILQIDEFPIKVRIGYSHLQPNLQVKAGENVTECQSIGFMGYSGVDFVNTHLHLGVSIDPQKEARFVYQDNQKDPLQTLFRYQWNAQEGCNEIIL